MPQLLFFLLATLGLSLWLGLQAVVAARSHRRTAEGILRDYAGIAAWEYSRRTRERLDFFLRELFDDVPRRVRREPPPSPHVVASELSSALRRIGCPCEALREEAVFLYINLNTGEVESIPDTISEAVRSRAAERTRGVWSAAPAERIALAVAGPGEVLDRSAVLAFNASLDARGEEGRGRAIYVFLTPLDAWGEFFSSWPRRASLLPEVVSGPQPNDSLLHIALFAPGEHPVLPSSREEPNALMVRDTLAARYGGLVVEVGVRTDAAGALVIGGLPRTRLPLLLALMLMAVGVGVAALVQIRKEEELARLREDFISGVSHEFRTPLTQIRMFTELMADGKLRSSEEWDRSIAVINRESRRLTHLVENVLHFSPMEGLPAHRSAAEKVVVREAIQDLREAFAPLVQDRGASLDVRVDPADAVALASRGGLHQMLANLLDNALKYGPRGQTIQVRGQVRDGRVRITVEDQGPGIPSSETQRVWRPYHRLQRDMDDHEKGSGIGLSVVKRIAESLGGSAWVEEGGSGGSRFVVDLPAGGEEA
jgi:signal transduction histidine kinase